jgi:DNA-binding response OmpR family regulator
MRDVSASGVFFTLTVGARGHRRGLMPTQGILGKSILLVEDEEALRSLLTTVLEDAGFSVTAIRLAEDAPEVLRVNSPDLIVLDLAMPGGTMQGTDLLAMLREADAWKHVPVVVLSGYGDVVNPDIMTRLGASAVLTKPLAEIEILPATIRAILG